MQWAGNAMGLKSPPIEGRPCMGAAIFEGVILPFELAHSNELAVYLAAKWRFFRYLVFVNQRFVIVAHRCLTMGRKKTVMLVLLSKP